jgi:hypothetical protein
MSSDDEDVFPVRRHAPDDEPRKDAVFVQNFVRQLIPGVSFACPYNDCGMTFTSKRFLDVHENEAVKIFFSKNKKKPTVFAFFLA